MQGRYHLPCHMKGRKKMQAYDVWAIDYFPFMAEHFGDCKTYEALHDACWKADPYIEIDFILEEIADMGIALYGNDPRIGKNAVEGYRAYLQYGFEIAYYEINADDLNADAGNHVTE